jgi:hypothetical protein
MKRFRTFCSENLNFNKYVHADSTSVGCPLKDVLFDRINRAMFEENAPFWIPIPDKPITNNVEAWHICSFKNYQYIKSHEGQFQISCSKFPNPLRMKTGIKGINSGGGILLKINGKPVGMFAVDQSTVVSDNRRWIMAKQLSVPNLIDKIRNLRNKYLKLMIKIGPKNWNTWKEMTMEEAIESTDAWSYTIGGWWNQNATPELQHWLNDYYKELCDVVDHYDLSSSLYNEYKIDKGRVIHDEVIMSRGWKIIEVIPITAESKEALKDIDVVHRSFKDLSSTFTYPKL